MGAEETVPGDTIGTEGILVVEDVEEELVALSG
jgi:hypothetical protein